MKIGNSLTKPKEHFLTESLNSDWVTYITSNNDVFSLEEWSRQIEFKVNTAPAWQEQEEQTEHTKELNITVLFAHTLHGISLFKTN